jgi:hypothetical protein
MNVQSVMNCVVGVLFLHVQVPIDGGQESLVTLNAIFTKKCVLMPTRHFGETRSFDFGMNQLK